MQPDVLFALPIAVSFLLKMVEGTIMCSSCRSDTFEACETAPPSPQPCMTSGSGVVKACSTVRIFNIVTKELSQFIRSCSNSASTGNNCFDRPPGFRTCAKICYTDGCNQAHSLGVVGWPWLPMCLILIMTLIND